MRPLCTSLLLLISLAVAAKQGPERPQFEVPPENVTESGYIKLSWGWKEGTTGTSSYEFELQQAKEAGFMTPEIIYQGRDYATFLSGLRNGDYYYRVRAKEGSAISDWSGSVMVRVQHHSLAFAFTLFGLGALVFLLTVGIVVRGNQRIARNL